MLAGLQQVSLYCIVSEWSSMEFVLDLLVDVNRRALLGSVASVCGSQDLVWILAPAGLSWL